MNTGAMTKERGANAECGKNYEIPDQRFDTKVKCPTGRASSFGSMGQIIFPFLRSKTPVKYPAGVCLGVWMVLELTGALYSFKTIPSLKTS